MWTFTPLEAVVVTKISPCLVRAQPRTGDWPSNSMTFWKGFFSSVCHKETAPASSTVTKTLLSSEGKTKRMGLL